MNKNDTLIKLLFGVIQGLMIAVLINLWAQLGTLRAELNDVRAVAAELKERVRDLSGRPGAGDCPGDAGT